MTTACIILQGSSKIPNLRSPETESTCPLRRSKNLEVCFRMNQNTSEGGDPQPYGMKGAPPPYEAYAAAPPGMVPPQNSHPPPPPPTQPEVVIHTQQIPVIVDPTMLGTRPRAMQCVSCHALIRTQVTLEPTTNTHLVALILCLIGGLCCVCIPYCVDDCQGARHNCPACGAYLGTYQK